jgi:nucleoside-diphosphate-sugar epimerase
MRILFTGGSSFTGFWFLRELSTAGHDVTAVFRKRAPEYSDEIRRQRVTIASRVCRPVHGTSFGEASFLSLLKDGSWDLFCHHAAEVTNYRSSAFDAIGAVANNTRELPAVLDCLKSAGCSRVLLTGSVFEGGEGAGSEDLPDLSPYGLSKALSARVFRYYCARAEIGLGKFVIPNPFGPHEEPRYTAYLMKTWLHGGTPSCSSPAYVRDNIPVSLLAKAYCRFAESLEAIKGFHKINPCGYIESQGAFTLRVAREVQARLSLPCPVELKPQTEFPEPWIRINTDVPDAGALGWDESAAWDDFTNYYLQLHAKQPEV